MADSRKPIYLCDIDGTIADISHRLHFIQQKPANWDAFFRACVDDLPIQEVIDTVRLLKRGGAPAHRQRKEAIMSSSKTKRRLARQHRRRARAKLRRGSRAVRAHNRPRPNGMKIRVKH